MCSLATWCGLHTLDQHARLHEEACCTANTPMLAVQGEKLSSAALITLVQILVFFVLGISIPAELYQLTLFLPNSR